MARRKKSLQQSPVVDSNMESITDTTINTEESQVIDIPTQEESEPIEQESLIEKYSKLYNLPIVDLDYQGKVYQVLQSNFRVSTPFKQIRIGNNFYVFIS